jgi:hypothetical protein
MAFVRRGLGAVASAALAALVATACGEKEGAFPAGTSPPQAAVAGPDAGDEALSAVASRLGAEHPFEVAAARPNAALACLRGEVEALDVLVCRYSSSAELEQAMPKLKSFVAGALSGVVRQREGVAMAVADRAKVDPKGEAISRLIARFEAKDP